MLKASGDHLGQSNRELELRRLGIDLDEGDPDRAPVPLVDDADVIGQHVAGLGDAAPAVHLEIEARWRLDDDAGVVHADAILLFDLGDEDEVIAAVVGVGFGGRDGAGEGPGEFEREIGGGSHR